MDPDRLARWIEMGLRLAASGPEKLEQIEAALGDVVDAQETIAGFDWQLALRPGRPRKRYTA